MKILPPISHWLPALLQSRAGQALAGVLVIITGLAVAFNLVDRPETADLTPRTATAKPASGFATYEPAATSCSGLVLDRSHHAVTHQPCPQAAIRAGASIVSKSPLSRSSMPPRGNRLTPADRAIAVPETLRTSVWDVGIAPTTPSRASPPPTIISGETAKP